MNALELEMKKVEIRKLHAEADMILVNAAKTKAETVWYPMAVAVGLISAGAGLVAAIAAFIKFF